MTDRELMQEAWEALNLVLAPFPVDDIRCMRVAKKLQERLAQPERIQLTVRDFVVTVGGLEDAVGTPTYWAEWPNKEQA